MFDRLEELVEKLKAIQEELGDLFWEDEANGQIP